MDVWQLAVVDWLTAGCDRLTDNWLWWTYWQCLVWQSIWLHMSTNRSRCGRRCVWRMAQRVAQPLRSLLSYARRKTHWRAHPINPALSDFWTPIACVPSRLCLYACSVPRIGRAHYHSWWSSELGFYQQRQSSLSMRQSLPVLEVQENISIVNRNYSNNTNSNHCLSFMSPVLSHWPGDTNFCIINPTLEYM